MFAGVSSPYVSQGLLIDALRSCSRPGAGRPASFVCRTNAKCSDPLLLQSTYVRIVQMCGGLAHLQSRVKYSRVLQHLKLIKGRHVEETVHIFDVVA